MNFQEELRRRAAETKRSIDRRTAELGDGVEALEARGRQLWDAGNRMGLRLQGKTAAELRELARAAQQGRLPAELLKRAGVPMGPPQSAQNRQPAAQGAPKPKAPTPRKSDVVRQGQAALSGAVDEASFGLADRVGAAFDAAVDGVQGRGQGFFEDYRDNMAVKREEDAYDAERYGTARNVGRVAGFAGSLAALGAPAVARGVVSLLPHGARIARGMTSSRYALDPRGLPTMAATGGAAAGVIGQGVSDATTGRRGSLQDYGGAALGGALDGLATLRLGPAAGGAIGGGTTTMAQDVLNGRQVSLDETLDSARLSAVTGQAAGVAGNYVMGRLTPNAKGAVGSALSQLKTIARGDGLPFGIERRLYLDDGGYTVTDMRFRPRGAPGRLGVGEAKMGPEAKLTPRQTQTREQFRRNGDEYVVDGWTYDHVGRMTGAAASPWGAQFVHVQQDPQRSDR